MIVKNNISKRVRVMLLNPFLKFSSFFGKCKNSFKWVFKCIFNMYQNSEDLGIKLLNFGSYF